MTKLSYEQIRSLMEAHHLLLQEEKARAEEEEKGIEEAKALVVDRERAYQQSILRQSALNQVIFLHKELLDQKLQTSPEEDAADQKKEAKKPARIGQQHYRILKAIQKSNPSLIYDISEASHVNVRRLKYQLIEDVKEGIVTETEKGFSLTRFGEDYLKRFEAYRTQNGQALPSLEEPEVSEETEAPDADNDLLGESVAAVIDPFEI